MKDNVWIDTVSFIVIAFPDGSDETKRKSSQNNQREGKNPNSEHRIQRNVAGSGQRGCTFTKNEPSPRTFFS